MISCFSSCALGHLFALGAPDRTASFGGSITANFIFEAVAESAEICGVTLKGTALLDVQHIPGALQVCCSTGMLLRCKAFQYLETVNTSRGEEVYWRNPWFRI